MLVINAVNVNEALPLGIMHLQSAGIEIAPRGQRTIEYPTPVTTVYQRPLERVLFEPLRDANHIFHLMEALWILGGRDDVQFPCMFNSKLAQYSDNGLTFHGAYGHRLRSCGKDQLKLAIDKLQRDPDTRQVVLQIWDYKKDLNVKSNDIPCLSGETRIKSPEGDISIEEIYNKFELGEITRYPVYTFNEKTQCMEYGWLTGVVLSGVKPVIKITLDTGSVLKVTKDHRMYKRLNHLSSSSKAFEITEASDLKIGDRLLSTVFGLTPKGHVTFKRNLFENTCFDNVFTEHSEYFKFIYGEYDKNYDIHHIDSNKINNSILNLELVNHGEHSGNHKLGLLNPIHKEDEISRRKRLTKRRNSLRNRGWDVPHHPDDEIFNIDEKIEKIKPNTKRKPRYSKIVSIEECHPESVYDFCVEDNHNCAIESGVIVHNCNDLVICKIRDNKLNITVCNRSNDLIWGLAGANAVQFSYLQEYLALMIGCEVGTYRQVSDSFHAYLDNPQWEKLQNIAPNDVYPYEYYPLIEEPKTFDIELKEFLNGQRSMFYDNRFFQDVAVPMYDAWFAHKDTRSGAEHADKVKDQAWRAATLQWLAKRGDK